MNPGGAICALSFIAAERVVPGYGGGMSSAKAQLESDMRVLSFELGRMYGLRINTISAGALKSRAAQLRRAKWAEARMYPYLFVLECGAERDFVTTSA